jgi:hypothetical protein
MTESWFAAGDGRWVAMLALLTVVVALEPMAKQGRHRSFVLGTFAACIAIGLAFLTASAIGFLSGQPRYVVVPLFAGGLSVAGAFTGAFFAMRKTYADAELRRTVASDL